jgi:hypothetical protein
MDALFIFFMLFSSFTFFLIVFTIDLKIERVISKYEKIKGKVRFKNK